MEESSSFGWLLISTPARKEIWCKTQALTGKILLGALRKGLKSEKQMDLFNYIVD
jgi:hypothetical protein